MNLDGILVSVIIPTYKRNVSFLSRAIMSVLHQTYEKVEIIVVDDSPSNYECRNEIAAYMAKLQLAHNNISYVQNEWSLGGALARNRGIELAGGEYITFLDDDDEYKPEKVEKQLRFMLETGCDMSFSNMVMYDQVGRVVDARSYEGISDFDNRTLLKYHLTHKITGTPTFMFRAIKLREIGGFDDVKMGQEFYLMLKTIDRGLTIRYLNDCDVIVYKHSEGSISQGRNKIEGEKRVFRSIQKYFKTLSPREKRYATFRHWAVMAVAYKRNKMYIHMVAAGMMAVLCSPLDFVMEIINYFSKIRKA